MIGKPLYRSLFSNKDWRPATLPQKVPAQVLSCQFYEIFKNKFLREYRKLLLISINLW